MAVLDRLNPQWSEAQEAEGIVMVKQALKEFDASGAAISLVISDAEIVKVQEGYGLGRETIKRSQSFAAHALLSTEVLVVLDTHEVCRRAHRYCPTDVCKTNRTFRTGGLLATL